MNESKPYRLPDPEKQPDAFLVLLYKTLKKVPYDDLSWDRHFFPRAMKRAQELLEALGGNVARAAQCMQDLKNRFEADDMRWTLETVISYSYEWRADQEKRSDADCLRDLAKAYAGLGLDKVLLLNNRNRSEPPKREPDPEISEQEQDEGAAHFGRAKTRLARVRSADE